MKNDQEKNEVNEFIVKIVRKYHNNLVSNLDLLKEVYQLKDTILDLNKVLFVISYHFYVYCMKIKRDPYQFFYYITSMALIRPRVAIYFIQLKDVEIRFFDEIKKNIQLVIDNKLSIEDFYAIYFFQLMNSGNENTPRRVSDNVFHYFDGFKKLIAGIIVRENDNVEWIPRDKSKEQKEQDKTEKKQEDNQKKVNIEWQN